MISINSLQLNNFVTYKDQLFDFYNLFKSDNKILISGRNFDDSAFANDNGAGKSLIYEAILFVLFNRTTKNSNRDMLIGQHDKDMSVELSLSDSQNNLFWIKRYRKSKVYGNNVRFKVNGNEIFKSTSTETSEYLLKMLGISYQRIINTSIFESQDERSRFVYLGDKAAKTLLSQIKGIDIFIICHGIASSQLNELDKLIDQYEQKISNFKWKIKELKKEKKNLQTISKKFNQNKDERINELENSLKSESEKNEKLLFDFKEKEVKIEKTIVSLKKRLIKQSEIDLLQEKLEQITNQKSKIIQSKFVISSEYKKDKTLIEDLKNKKVGTVCDHCGNEIKKSSLKKHKAAIIKKSLSELKTLEQIKNQIIDLENRELKLSSKIKNLKNKNSKTEELLFKKKSLKKKIKMKVNLGQKKFNAFKKFTENQIQKIKQEEDLQKESIEKIKKEILQLKKEISLLVSEKKRLENEQLYYNAWHNGYNKEEIQTYALKSTVIQLNKEIKRISEILTDGFIEIELLTQKIQGNKTIRNIFELSINDLSKKDLPFKEWSAGQKKRIEIIISFALMNIEKNLISEIFLDELFDSVDRTGISKIVSLLDNETKYNKRFLIMSHSDDVKALFSNRGIVTLKDGISSFELE